MTVSTELTKVTYQGNGSTTVFSFPFAITTAVDIDVFLTDAAGTITQLPANEYQVAINPPVGDNPTSVGGSVTWPIPIPGQPFIPLQPGSFITIARTLPETQLTSISNQSVIYPPVIEQAFDRVIMIDQQITETLDRTVRVPITEGAMAPLPPLAFRANQQAIYDSLGNLTAGNIPGGGVSISPAMIPVVTAPTLPLARSAMGVAPIDSPVFTGNPTAPTPPMGDNDTTIATTAFVQAFGSALGIIIPSGTRMIFHQSIAPPGWTKDGTHHDKALRVVNGVTGSGGVTPFSVVFSRTTTNGHALSLSELAAHSHVVNDPPHSHGVGETPHSHRFQQWQGPGGTGEAGYLASQDSAGDFINSGSFSMYNPWPIEAVNTGIFIHGSSTGISIQYSGASQPHFHDMDIRVLYVDVIIAQKD
jgi:hypothetical protein